MVLTSCGRSCFSTAAPDGSVMMTWTPCAHRIRTGSARVQRRTHKGTNAQACREPVRAVAHRGRRVRHRGWHDVRRLEVSQHQRAFGNLRTRRGNTSERAFAALAGPGGKVALTTSTPAHFYYHATRTGTPAPVRSAEARRQHTQPAARTSSMKHRWLPSVTWKNSASPQPTSVHSTTSAHAHTALLNTRPAIVLRSQRRQRGCCVGDITCARNKITTWSRAQQEFSSEHAGMAGFYESK